MLTDYIKLGFSNIAHRKLRSWLTMVGIVIGIAAIVALISLGQGLENFVVGQFSIVGTDVINVQASGTGQGPPGTGVVEPLTKTQLERVSRIAGVDVAVGRILPSGNIEYNDEKVFGFAQSVPDDREGRNAVHDILNLETEEGRLLKEGDTYSVVLGSDFMEDDIFGERVRLGDKVKINSVDFTVVGFLKAKGSFVLDGSALVSEQVLRDVVNRDDDAYDFFGVRVTDVNDIGKVEEDIKRVMRKERDVDEGDEDFTVTTPQAALENLKSTLFAVQLFVYIIAGVSLVVGGIGIMNTMYTAVLERTKEIGIMKAIGATTEKIFSIFLIESGVLGLVGGIVGMGLGVGIASGFAKVAELFMGTDLVQVHFTPGLIIGSLVFSLLLGSLAGMLPALQAAKLNPVDALSYAK